VPPGPDIEPVGPWLTRLNGTLPRAFIISDEAFERLNRDWPALSANDLLKCLRAEIARHPPVISHGPRGRTLTFDVPNDTNGYLVANQAYSSNWSRKTECPVLFGELFPAWKINSSGSRTVALSYWPRGLTWGLALAISGLSLLVTILMFRNSYSRSTYIRCGMNEIIHLAAPIKRLHLIPLACLIILCLIPLLSRLWLPFNVLAINN